jgi:predicted esterase
MTAEPLIPPALIRSFAGLVLLPATGVGGIAIVLLFVAETWPGRALGLGFALLSTFTVLLPLALAPAVAEPLAFTEEEAHALAREAAVRRRRHLRQLLPLGALALACLGWAWVVAPPAEERPLADTPGLQSVWLGPARPSRLGLSWVTPERDQLVLATHLMWAADPWLEREEAAAFRDDVQRIYDEMASEPSYADPGSALGFAYLELLGGPDVTGHVYVDLAPAPGPQPALVFIHGFGGSAASYLWVLRRAAHARGWAIVAPGYGAGLWYQPEGAATVERTLDWMQASGRFDMDRLVLAGLSNGGFGVTAAATLHPWRGLAWLSGVLDPNEMTRLSAIRAPMLVLHGGTEDRIPLPFVSSAVDTLRAGGADVTFDVVPDADHFLLFSHRDRVDAALDAWLTRAETP